MQGQTGRREGEQEGEITLENVLLRADHARGLQLNHMESLK